MKSARNSAFDHGAALRTPPAHDARGWVRLCAWLGDEGRRSGEVGVIQVQTPHGWVEARPGDWVILSVAGTYHVASTRGAAS